MPQDQPNESPEMRAALARMIDKGHVKTGTVPQDQVPPAAFPTYQDPVPEVRPYVPPFRHVPDANLRHIGDAVREWTYQALRAVSQGGRIDWDVSLGLAPAGGGAFVSAYILVIYMPSIILSDPPIGVVRVIPDDPDQDQIRTAVLSAVGEIKDKQNAMLNPHG
jgi:hypothetical protein